MSFLYLDGNLFKKIVENGALNLQLNKEMVNTLNVFPVPDGDTGTNMFMTIQSGLNEISSNNSEDISVISKQLAKGMLLGARGNSGVILSQIFKGLSNGLTYHKEVNALQLSEAFENAVSQSYHAVVRPVEGTILTVLRVAVENSKRQINANTTIEDYFTIHLEHAKETLKKTKEILPVLKEANVIDSGGAGYVSIIEGMLDLLLGKKLGELHYTDQKEEAKASDIAFDENSELNFGYCTEFVLQLQSKKVNVSSFDISTIIDYLNTIGDSIVAIKDGSIVKVHVHTKNPGDVLNFGRKYGEFISVKIENMTLQHNEIIKESIPKKEHKKYGVVAVANGEGIINQFKDFGVDVTINGGQTMNPSSNDFIKAYEQIDADYIFVLPNNKNIFLAAKQSQSLYAKSKIIVINSKTISEGYSALTMLDFDNQGPLDIENTLNESARNVHTGLITYSIRDCDLKGKHINKGDYIGISNDDDAILSLSDNPTDCAFDFINNYSDIQNRDVVTIIYGNNVSEDSANNLLSRLKDKYSDKDFGLINGKQDIYSFIIGIE